MLLRRLLSSRSLWTPLFKPAGLIRYYSIPALLSLRYAPPSSLSKFQIPEMYVRWMSSEGSRGEGESKAGEAQGKKSLMIDEEDYDAITDKIPEKPMTAAEGISYTVIIIAAFAILGACLWAFVSNYIWNPVEYTCFNLTLDKLRTDPRVTVRIGQVIKGYGSDSMNRRQRHIIRNRKYVDESGRDHTQIQFNIKGSEGVGIVYADMFQDDSKTWQYTYLYVDFPDQGRSSLQRLALVTPTV